MISKNTDLSKLRQTNESVQKADHKELLFRVSNFMNTLIINSELLSSLDKEIETEQQIDTSELLNQATIFIDKLYDYNEKIKEFCNKNTITLPISVHIFDEYFKQKENLIQGLFKPSLMLPPDNYQQNFLRIDNIKHNESHDCLVLFIVELRTSIEFLLDIVNTNEILYFLKTMANIDQDKNFSGLLIEQELINYHKAKNSCDNAKPYTSWYKALLFQSCYNEYQQYENVKLEFEIRKGCQFNDNYKSETFKILDQVTKGLQPALVNDLKQGCQIIFDKILQIEATSNKDTNNLPLKNIFIKYDDNTGTLYIGIHKIIFPQKKSQSRKFLKVITNSIESLHQEWTRYAIQAKINQKISGPSFYASCAHIQDQVLKQSKNEFPKFFKKLSKNTLQINPDYLLTYSI